MTEQAYTVLPHDSWGAATAGLVGEVTRMDTVFFTSLVDAAALEALRTQAGRRPEAKPSYTALVLKAISLALRSHPHMNRLVLGGWFRHRPVQLHEVHAVVAVERVLDGIDTVQAGLIRNTDARSLAEIQAELRRLASCSEGDDPRQRLFMRLVRWAPGFLCRCLIGMPRFGPGLWLKHRGGAFALTTVGKYGVDSVSAKWPWPLTFTFGEVKERPMAVNGQVDARQSFYLSMGFQRNLCNGAPAARFFKCIIELLEEGPKEWIDSPELSRPMIR